MAEKKFSVIVTETECARCKIAVKVDGPDAWLSYPFEMMFQEVLNFTKESVQIWAYGLRGVELDKSVTLREEDADLAGGSDND